MRQLRFLIKIDELMSLAVKRSYVVYESYRNIYIAKSLPTGRALRYKSFAELFQKRPYLLFNAEG